MSGLRIAMWSGPRNISTAMMRAWENRGDTAVSDEPFYAHYLVATGAAHPGREEIIASQSTDYARVASRLTGAIPDGNPIWYQKHMTQHVLAGNEIDWLDRVENCFLIRRPEEVVASFTANRPDAAPWELGFEQQIRLFDHVCDCRGAAPPVLDAADVLKAPDDVLRTLCDRLGVVFSERMLSWPAGPRASDGIWAKYWYHSVEASTGFAPYRPRETQLNAFQQRLVEQCRPAYEHLARWRLVAD
ncbi:MAG: HAD family hydrolase [Gammaproteobacteria bacterium]